MRVALPFVFLPSVAGHGAVTHPKPRNAVDGMILPWNGTVPDPIPFTTPNWCASPSSDSTDSRKLTGSQGQACFWFNNGCDIGCDKCDGETGQKIPCCVTKFLYKGADGAIDGRSSWTDPNSTIVMDPAWLAKFDITKMRPKFVKYPDRKPTICDPKLRTINTHAECGSKEDLWHYTPWRYPGIAPVTDPCGTAGGVLPGQPNGAAGASYITTTNNKVGDLGSKLSPLSKGFGDATVWGVGTDVEVSWALKAWHGGGYSYRLCRADKPLTEACFQQTPLLYAQGNESAALRWGGIGGQKQYFDPAKKGWQVSEGTVPTGSMWRKIPIPRTINEWNMYGASFEPVCKESDACRLGKGAGNHGGPCKCSGDWNDEVEIVDKVHIPSDLAPGKYVLGWRWDCEESTQVWGSCSDVTIVAK